MLILILMDNTLLKVKNINTNYNKYDEAFLNWLVEDNRFYNTLVDRIVPGYPAANAKEIESKDGILRVRVIK